MITNPSDTALNRPPATNFPQDPVHREALYAELQPLVRRLIRQYGDTSELREELVSELYVRFCALLEAYDPSRGVPLRPYLIRTLSAHAYTYARALWRKARREVSGAGVGSAWEPIEAVDPTPAWDEALHLAKVRERLPEAIAALPQRQRQVVIWRYYEGREYEEIAALLQVRPATVRSLLRHGLTNLRGRFKEPSLG